jgi:23S rRNA (cytidine1920-2'-O)/16S rRNA (cytidine1409-2'-O)-methyltransferase
MKKQRLDTLLVVRGLTDNKNKARALIMAGEVKVNGHVQTKPGNPVSEDASIDVAGKLPYVGRGGLKLAHALDEFMLNVNSIVAMDIGASTGGFTDCLLQRGVSQVYALDVGYGQLDYKLRQDPRVTVMDRTNAHYPFTLPEKADLAVIDVSFISATKVIPNVIDHLKKPGCIVLLLKPQFEAERGDVGKGGVIKDPLVHATVIGNFVAWAIENRLRVRGLTTSPIQGAEGNREFLVLLKTQECTIKRIYSGRNNEKNCISNTGGWH